MRYQGGLSVVQTQYVCSPSSSHTTSSLYVTVVTAKRTIRAKYCLAADGARSFMRNTLNIGWEGTKPNMTWAVLD